MPRSKLFILKLAAALSCLACLTSLNLQLLNDGAAIYVNGWQPGTSIDHNVIHDVLKTPAHITDFLISGIYLDGGSISFQVHDNLTYRIEWGGIFLNEAPGNANNKVWNNIFVDGVENQLGLFYASEDSFYQNIIYDGRTPSTALFYTGNGEYPLGTNSIHLSDNNLFYAPSVPNFMAQLNKWKALGFDAHSIVAYPQFVDYAHDNFTLDPSSPALRPIGGGGIGFLPIDFGGLP